jgi:hypothetical protein
MGGIGALFAGLFLGLRDLVPYMAARRSGVISRKGALNIRVRRDEDPDRFARLLANRSKGAALGFGLSVVGAIVLSLFALALAGSGGPLAILIFIVYAGFTIFATYCLVRGFATGRMFVFWSFTMFGEATRKESPTWFWVYAALNVVIVLAGAFVLLQALAR